jgi:hypothetical protein
MSKIDLEARQDEMKQRMSMGQAQTLRQELAPIKADEEPSYDLNGAAVRLGLPYKMTWRLMRNRKDIHRFSGTDGTPYYPGMPLKRFQRVRLTYRIPESTIQRVLRSMAG